MANECIVGSALVISLLITIMFFIKAKVPIVETKIFKKMLIINILESLSTTLIVVVALTINSTFILKLLNRIEVILWNMSLLVCW